MGELFTKADLKKLIIPLLIEQVLAVSIGIPSGVENGMFHIGMLFVMRPLIGCFGLPVEATEIAVMLLRSFALCAVFMWPLSFTVPNILRAAGDAKFTMKVSVFSMWVFWVISSYFIAGTLGVGVLGVWIGMYIDWFFRSCFFAYRYLRGKWLNAKVV